MFGQKRNYYCFWLVLRLRRIKINSTNGTRRLAMKKMLFILALAAVFIVGYSSPMLVMAFSADTAEALGRAPAPSSVPESGGLPVLKDLKPLSDIGRGVFISEVLDQSSPYVALLVEGEFSSKQEYEALCQKAIAYVKRKYGGLWKEERSVVGIHGERHAVQANNGKLLNNVKVYYTERRVPKEGMIVGRINPKPRQATGPPPGSSNEIRSKLPRK